MPFFLQRTYRSDLLRDFYTYYAKRRGSAQENVFGVKKYSIFNLFICKKKQKNYNGAYGKN